MSTVINYGNIKAVKLFASSEYKSRNEGYKCVVRLVKTRAAGDGHNQLSSNDVISIWKGLYMWLWMQDKPILHEEVVGKICALLTEIKSIDIAIFFIESFFITMVREWKKIDIHRMDKFYMLSRDFLTACLNWLKTNDMAEQFVNIISTKVFDGVIDKGVEFKLHIIDILLDEFICTESSETLVTKIITEAITSMLTCSQKHPYVLRMKKRVIERLIPLFLENKLQINLQEIGTYLGHIERTVDMFGKMKKLCRGLSKGFLNCKKRNDFRPIIQDNISNCIMTECNINTTTDEEMEGSVTTVEITCAPECKVTLITEDDCDKVVLDKNTAIEMDTEEIKTDNNPAEIAEKPKKVKNHKKIKEIKPNVRTDEQPVTTLKRKVSFGKKFTKKFKKGVIDVSLSQGTIRNTDVKSILKKT